MLLVKLPVSASSCLFSLVTPFVVAKKLLALLGSDSRSVAEIVEANGWSPMSETQLQALCEQIVHSGTDDAAVQKAVARARSGDQRALRFFIGQVGALSMCTRVEPPPV